MEQEERSVRSGVDNVLAKIILQARIAINVQKAIITSPTVYLVIATNQEAFN